MHTLNLPDLKDKSKNLQPNEIHKITTHLALNFAPSGITKQFSYFPKKFYSIFKGIQFDLWRLSMKNVLNSVHWNRHNIYIDFRTNSTNIHLLRKQEVGFGTALYYHQIIKSSMCIIFFETTILNENSRAIPKPSLWPKNTKHLEIQMYILSVSINAEFSCY